MSIMRVPGCIYRGGGEREYLGVYNYQHDISVKLPPGHKEKHIAHVSYSKGHKLGGIDVFQFRGPFPDLSDIATIKKGFRRLRNGAEKSEEGTRTFIPTNTNSIEQEYGVQKEFRRDTSPEVEAEVTRLTDADIFNFCEEEVASKPREPRTRHVRRIMPVTQAKYITPTKMITGGKQWTVPECVLEGNIDYGQGCIAAWIPVGKKANFNGETFTDWFSYRWGECSYPCYAERKHRCPPKTIYEFDKDRLRAELSGGCMIDFEEWEKQLGRPLDRLRFGKRTEPWTPWSQDHFIDTLEVMTETGTRGIITTRFMPFIPEIAELAKKTRSTILYSIGLGDKFELGPSAHGCNEAFRLEQAALYNEARANSNIYLMIQAHNTPTSRERRILDLGLPTQLLPVRFRQKIATQRIAKHTWEELKGGKKTRENEGFLPIGPYGAYMKVGNDLVIKTERIHPAWKKLVAKNNGRIRMCHHDNRTLYCGGCFQRKGEIFTEQNHT
jgi:hypothetical protein